MEKLGIVAAFLLFFWASVLPLQAKTLFHDDFSDGDNWEDNWYHLGSPGGEILQVDGHLELDRSKLASDKQLSAVAKEGDYDPDPSFPVKTEGKLGTTWGGIKANWQIR